MALSYPEKKALIRSRHLAIRKSILPEERKLLSKSITDRIIKSEEFQAADTVHSYVAIENKREVNTDDFINICLKHGKNVIVPKMKSNGELSHHQINSLDSLKPNEWGVPEPLSDSDTTLKDGILIVVPMVASDFKKNRIGYGKGYYDRFLSKIKSTKIGLCFSFNLCWNTLPVERYDVKMDIIVTDGSTLK